MKKLKQRGLFDDDFRLEKISKIGDPLEKLNRHIDWERFRPQLENICKKGEAEGPGGRPPYDYVMMFKILILQSIYDLSDAQTEFQINDRLTFMRFLCLGTGDTIPDEKTIWHFRELLKENKAVKKLFHKFTKVLKQQGVETKRGKIIDASIIEVPTQRNSRDENEQIKRGEVPSEWEKPENNNMLKQKDLDARWIKKNGKSYYGYKNHIKVDAKTKLIEDFVVTDASVHDSQAIDDLVGKKDNGNAIYADSAYSGEPVKKKMRKRKVKAWICAKGYRNQELTEKQKEANHRKSKVRVRVEHVFGHMKYVFKFRTLRSIGKIRAEVRIGLINLSYNIYRYSYLQQA